MCTHSRSYLEDKGFGQGDDLIQWVLEMVYHRCFRIMTDDMSTRNYYYTHLYSYYILFPVVNMPEKIKNILPTTTISFPGMRLLFPQSRLATSISGMHKHHMLRAYTCALRRLSHILQNIMVHVILHVVYNYFTANVGAASLMSHYHCSTTGLTAYCLYSTGPPWSV